MLRKPAFWIVFVLFSAVCLLYAVRNFSDAFPLVTLDLRMDRETALAEARESAGEHQWGPEDSRSAASFQLDRRVQSFVELEGGGTEAFAKMLAGDLYSPYRWMVRIFREGETNEVMIRFTPQGEPYGFRETLPEDEPGATLDSEAAREVAVAAAVDGWGLALDQYEPVETSQEVLPGGRVDHTFVYERPEARVAEDGRYRLRLVVGGDRLTELTHFVKIPEAFERRYEEMRSANNGIAAGAGFAVAILYLAGGCVIGLFFLLRERWVLWRAPLKWGVFVAFLQFLVTLNRWPLLWMGYDTATSSATFAMQQVGMALAQFVGMGAILTLSFMAAESLGRKAFPHHIQLWRSWTGEVAASPGMLGRTVAGYLLISVFFAYEVVLYFLASDHLGWWTPSDALFDPNVLATVFPWLTSVGISLQAGFWEECLFRAVPLACAALLGRRFGRPWMWIAVVMVLQAVIFGAGHANYPAQPSWARMVELIIPALGFGGLYLLWGLVPAIVFHFAYDVVWFALPLFAASSSGIWIDRSIVIVLTLIPLFVVLGARLRLGRWGVVTESDLNRSWTPPPAKVAIAPRAKTAFVGLGTPVRLALLVLGIVGLVAWALSAGFRTDAPGLTSSTEAAKAAARGAVVERGFTPDGPWKELTNVLGSPGVADRFVWQEGGTEAYDDLLGSYLAPPRRLVRYARFTGDVAERAEEWRVYVGPDGGVRRTTHRLPEGRPGAELGEDEARSMALGVLRTVYGLEADQVEEVSAEPSQLDARRDWRLVFSDPGSYPLEDGDARIAVYIAGDEVSDTSRFIHVPEEWERAERNRRSAVSVVRVLSTLMTVVLFLVGAVTAVVRWSRGEFARTTFAWFAGLLAVMGLVSLANSWPALAAQFMTAQPFRLQAVIALIAGAIAMLGIAVVSSLLIGLVHSWLAPQPVAEGRRAAIAGVGLGAAFAGLSAVATHVGPATQPLWGDLSEASSLVPFVGVALGELSSFLTGTALMLFVVAAVLAATRGWTRWRIGFSALIVLLGLVVAGAERPESLSMWVAAGLATGFVALVVFVLVLRRHPAVLLPAAATAGVLEATRRAVIGAHPGATLGSVLGAALVAAVAVWWFNRLTADTQPTGRSVEVAPAQKGEET